MLQKPQGSFKNYITPPVRFVGAALLSLFILTGIGSILFLFFEYEMQQLNLWLTERLGLFGVAIYVFIADGSIVPIFPVDLVFLLAHDWNPIPLITVVTTSSILGGVFDYFLGRVGLGKGVFKRIVPNYLNNRLQIVEKGGFISVFIAALTPLPYATIAYIAGQTGVKLPIFLFASLGRIPRMAVYFAGISSSISVLSG